MFSFDPFGRQKKSGNKFFVGGIISELLLAIMAFFPLVQPYM